MQKSGLLLLFIFFWLVGCTTSPITQPAPLTTPSSATFSPATTRLPLTPLPTSQSAASQATSLPTPNPEDAINTEAERLLGHMSLEEQVGQVMIIALRDKTVSPFAAEMIRDRHVGGVILFTRNLGTPPQAREFTNALQNLARSSGAKIPLFTALDQEGGIVNRAAEGVTVWPGQMLIGGTGDPAMAARMASLTALELRAVGMNTNFAPVMDVNNNPDNPVIGTRSFGAGPRLVAKLGIAMIGAYQQAGVLAVAKHFPGHGDTNVDSHVALPVIDKSLAQLETLELVPFRAAIEAGVDGIMSAHIALPQITGDQPASLSRAVLTDLLRTQMGFQGLIITDDLEMGAIVERYGTAEAAVLAFKAGSDLLLFRFNEQEQRTGYDLLLAAVKNDPALQTQLADSVRRILRAKLRRGLFAPGQSPDLAQVGAPEHLQAAIDTATAGITLVRNDDRLLPLRLNPNDPVLVITPAPGDLATVEVPLPGSISPGQALSRLHPSVQEQFYALDPQSAERASLLASARDAKIVVLATYNARSYPGQPQLVAELLATGKPLVIVSLRLPYDLVAFPGAKTYLAAYDDRNPTLIAVADALMGVRAPGGRLPVPLGDLYPIGYGLQEYTNSQ